MKHLIRTWLLIVFCILSHTILLAGKALPKPISSLPSGFFLTVRNLDSTINLMSRSISTKYKVKICSCQILNLKSNNYQHRDMGVFAERSSGGNYSADLSIAKRTIEKEKRHIKLLFYDKLRVVDSFSEATDCKSLYVRLKTKNNGLVIYDILNADEVR